jgi:CubicO group peptidase (beta-lactamase class C family)
MEFLNDLDNYIKVKRYRLINSVLVYQNDELIFERYYNRCDENSSHYVFSISKSIVGLTLGICLDKGWIKSVDEPIYHYLPQFDGSKQPYHKLITIRHLLTMSSGIYWRVGGKVPIEQQMQGKTQDGRLEHISDIQVTDLPGTAFKYNEWNPPLICEIIKKACGMNEWHICLEYLYKPLGIENAKWNAWRAAFDPYGDSPFNNRENSICTLCARDLAKIGLLMLLGGDWNGQRIISEEYIKAAVSPSEANSGYGYFWWLEQGGWLGLGWGGQELNIRPDKNALAVIQATDTAGNKFYREICPNIFSR